VGGAGADLKVRVPSHGAIGKGDARQLPVVACVVPGRAAGQGPPRTAPGAPQPNTIKHGQWQQETTTPAGTRPRVQRESVAKVSTRGWPYAGVTAPHRTPTQRVPATPHIPSSAPRLHHIAMLCCYMPKPWSYPLTRQAPRGLVQAQATGQPTWPAPPPAAPGKAPPPHSPLPTAPTDAQVLGTVHHRGVLH
jgi:hypothetical protein